MLSGQIITTSAEVTLNGGLVRELPQNPLNSGLGIILICPDVIPSLKLTASSPLKVGLNAPKGNESYSKHPFSAANC